MTRQSKHAREVFDVKAQSFHSAPGTELFGRPARPGDSAKNISDIRHTLNVADKSIAP